jgi:chorismate dehydratase
MIANHSHSASDGQTWRLGAVSYLNARPLVAPLAREASVQVDLDVPSRLAPRLWRGDYDAALIPVIELLRSEGDARIVSDACIAADGETMTVRVFSQVPPQDVQRIWLDGDSRTSVALARILWPGLYKRNVEFVAMPPDMEPTDCESVLLIGDKVVGLDPTAFRYHIDLGGAWKAWTGLPFVFAVWAAPCEKDTRQLAQVLGAARDRGIRQAGRLALRYGPTLGWPVDLAQQYLDRYMYYKLTAKFAEGMTLFLDLAEAMDASESDAVVSGVEGR